MHAHVHTHTTERMSCVWQHVFAFLSLRPSSSLFWVFTCCSAPSSTLSHPGLYLWHAHQVKLRQQHITDNTPSTHTANLLWTINWKTLYPSLSFEDLVVVCRHLSYQTSRTDVNYSCTVQLASSCLTDILLDPRKWWEITTCDCRTNGTTVHLFIYVCVYIYINTQYELVVMKWGVGDHTFLGVSYVCEGIPHLTPFIPKPFVRGQTPQQWGQLGVARCVTRVHASVRVFSLVSCSTRLIIQG